jgi:hypothetical protein
MVIQYFSSMPLAHGPVIRMHSAWTPIRHILNILSTFPYSFLAFPNRSNDIRRSDAPIRIPRTFRTATRILVPSAFFGFLRPYSHFKSVLRSPVFTHSTFPIRTYIRSSPGTPRIPHGRCRPYLAQLDVPDVG